MRLTLLAFLTVSISACTYTVTGTGEPAADDSEPGVTASALDLGGDYCGRAVSSAEDCQNDAFGFVRLQTTSSLLSGEWCEAHDAGCTSLVDATLDSRTLRFEYVDGTKPAVDCTFTVAATPNQLVGSCRATDGTLSPVTLYRI